MNCDFLYTFLMKVGVKYVTKIFVLLSKCRYRLKKCSYMSWPALYIPLLHMYVVLHVYYFAAVIKDTKKAYLAEVTNDSCTVEYTEIVPLDRASSDNVSNQTSGIFDRVVEVKPEDLQDVKQEPFDGNDTENENYSVKQEPAVEYETQGPCSTAQVSSACIKSSDFGNSQPRPMMFYIYITTLSC